MTEEKIKEWMGEAVPPTLDRAYNLAIDHAIEIVMEKRNHYPTSDELHYHLSDIISKLQALKNKFGFP